jgi:hypothetical protein
LLTLKLKKDQSKTFPPKHPSDLSSVGRDTSKLIPTSIFKVLQRKSAAGLLEFLKTAKPKDVNIVDADGQSPLHVACLVCFIRSCTSHVFVFSLPRITPKEFLNILQCCSISMALT